MALRSLLLLASSLLAAQCTPITLELSYPSGSLASLDGQAPDCTCLSRTEELNGGKINGVYSYIDPVGSLIEVTYSMNPDKTNYVEERKVIKGYENDGPTRGTGTLTVEEVVERVLNELTPTVIEVVRSTVQSSSFDLSSVQARRELVQTIIIELRPVVFQVVTQVLRETGTDYLDAGEMTDLIVAELTPVVEKGVSEESDKVLQQNQLSEGEVVQQIITQLRPTVIRIIEATVSTADLNNLDQLLATIMTQLRPVVYNEVQNALRSSGANYNPDSLTEKIIVKLTPFVSQALQAEVEKVKQQNQLSEEEVVQQIITQLRPTVIRIIEATVSTADLDNLDQLLATIMTQLRPVVYNEVQNALRSSGANYNPNSLTEKIIARLTPFVSQALEAEVEKIRQQNQLSEEEVVQQIIVQLQPTVIRIIQATVSTADLNNLDELLATIMTQLRPVVYNEVQNALRSSGANYNPDSLTEKIIARLTPFVSKALQAEVEKVRTKETKVVNDIKAEIDPVVLKVIETTVSATGADLNNPRNLVSEIIEQLRPIVFKAVRTALNSSPLKGLDPKKISVRIIIELTPVVEQRVDQEIEIVKKENSGLISSIVDRLGPAIIDTIQGLKGNVISEELMNEIIQKVTLAMRVNIKQKVAQIMSDPQSQSLPDQVLVDRISADLQGDIIRFIENDPKFRVVKNMKGFGQMVARIIEILKPDILREIQLWRRQNAPRPVRPVTPKAVTGDLSSIFGTGENFVKVNTPDINYGYEFGSSK